jgi:hypothetical protein
MAQIIQDFGDESIVSGEVVGDNLILTKGDGSTIDAGDVRGPIGPTAGAEIHGLTEIGSALLDADEAVVYDLSAAVNRKTTISRFWTYISSKIQGAASTILTNNLTASHVAFSNAAGKMAVSGNDDVLRMMGTLFAVNPNKINITYSSNQISTVTVRNASDSANVMVATFSYSGTQVNTITVVTTNPANTVVYTLNYTDSLITSITKAVS